MNRRGLFVSLLVGSLIFTAAAGFSQTPSDIDDRIEKCLGDEPVGPEPPTCTFDESGNLLTRTNTSPSPSRLGVIVVFALIWIAVPMVVAAVMASNRGESVGMAILLTLLLGWIGLAIVYFGQRKAISVVDNLASGAATEPVDKRSVADRLQALEELLRSRLITQDEFDARREAILKDT